jgi:hypothetical protein
MMMIKVRYNKRELMFQLPLHIMLSETNKITRELIEREREREKVRERERERERERNRFFCFGRSEETRERCRQQTRVSFFAPKTSFFPSSSQMSQTLHYIHHRFARLN